MTEYPNIYDWDDDVEHAEAGERLKKHLRDAEWLLKHPDMRDPENQNVIKKEITDLENNLNLWSASRRRRADFQRRRLIPKDEAR
jgi:hypothetical protein